MEQRPDERPHALFLEDFIDVACSHEAILRRWGAETAWLTDIANSATEDGEAQLIRIGPSWAAGVLTRKVRIRLGAPRERGATTVVPISWEAAEHTSLFPVLTGDLEITPLGEDVSRIGLAASYLTPLGELGRRLDRALLHHVAQSTVRSFLSRLAGSLGPDDSGAVHSSPR